MRTLAAAFAVLALATPAHAAPGVFDETEHISRTLPDGAGGTLRLKNFSGRVTITASDRPEVVIDAVRRAPRVAAGPHQARHPHVRLERRGRGRQPARPFLVGVRRRQQRRRDRLRHQGAAPDPARPVGVQLAGQRRPASKARTRLHGFSSPLVLNDVTGSVQAHTFSGSVTIREKSWESNQTHRRGHLQRQHRAARARSRPAARSPSTRSAAA